jgi:hypothetical protein
MNWKIPHLIPNLLRIMQKNKRLLKTSAKRLGLQKKVSYFWSTGKENEQR